MIELEINNETYYIPDNLKEVNIDKYIKVYNLPTGTTYYDIEVASILGDIPMGVLKNLDIKYIYKIKDSLEKMYNNSNYKVKKRIEIKNKIYELNNLEKASWGVYIDIMSLFNSDININNRLHLLNAILYSNSTNDDDIDNLSKIFLYHMDMETALGGLFFFMNSDLLSIKIIQVSLMKKMMDEGGIYQHLINSKKNGDGYI